MDYNQTSDNNRESEGLQRTMRPEPTQPDYIAEEQMAQARPSEKTCPNCGAAIDYDADFCEVCHTYVKTDVCSFCGAHLAGNEAFCPECGNPRDGIICPDCHTLNNFSFCKKCGAPLTDQARQLFQKIHSTPEFREVQRLANEIAQLDHETTSSDEADRKREEANHQLRRRVLALLAEDSGENFVMFDATSRRVSTKELSERKHSLAEELTQALAKMSVKPMTSPLKARNYAMATKPAGVRLAWVCNYKHAMHSGPCGCAKPQLGGKWVILGHNSSTSIIHDDK